jgi:uncharacterized membrane protein YvbJ
MKDFSSTILIMVIVFVIFFYFGRNSKNDLDKVDTFLNNVVVSNNPQKITFKVEVGTWGRKVVWIMEDIEWKNKGETEQ